jgi:hypothetical protein
MNNLYFFLIILVVAIAIYYIHTSSENNSSNSDITKEKEGFSNSKNFEPNILTLNPYERCKLLGISKFMVRDLKTRLWLTAGLQEGFNKFLPGRFGVSLVMSDKPDEYLPLRTVVEPNDYLLATYSGDGIRTVTNPYNKIFVLQVFIYNGFNVIGYINENETQLYMSIDDNGNISSTSNPSEASVVEIIEI